MILGREGSTNNSTQHYSFINKVKWFQTGLMSIVFASSLGDRGSISSQVIPHDIEVCSSFRIYQQNWQSC